MYGAIEIYQEILILKIKTLSCQNHFSSAWNFWLEFKTVKQQKNDFLWKFNISI